MKNVAADRSVRTLRSDCKGGVAIVYEKKIDFGFVRSSCRCFRFQLSKSCRGSNCAARALKQMRIFKNKVEAWSDGRGLPDKSSPNHKRKTSQNVTCPSPSGEERVSGGEASKKF